MKEQILKVKDYVKEHEKDVKSLSLLTGVVMVSFMAGRLSLKENIIYKASYTDKDGNLVKGVYQRIVK